VKILGSARPGETLRIEARVLGRLANLVQAEGVVSMNGETVLRAELTLSGT
jgi:3-hydroxymyristoyl/3-hydroxydecanoyl-(acyl carrier protein) dehydratase